MAAIDTKDLKEQLPADLRQKKILVGVDLAEAYPDDFECIGRADAAILPLGIRRIICEYAVDLFNAAFATRAGRVQEFEWLRKEFPNLGVGQYEDDLFDKAYADPGLSLYVLRELAEISRMFALVPFTRVPAFDGNFRDDWSCWYMVGAGIGDSAFSDYGYEVSTRVRPELTHEVESDPEYALTHLRKKTVNTELRAKVKRLN